MEVWIMPILYPRAFHISRTKGDLGRRGRLRSSRMISRRANPPAERAARRTTNNRGGRWTSEIEAFIQTKRSADGVSEAWLSRMRWELTRFPDLVRRVGHGANPRSARNVTEDQIIALREGLPWETPTFAIHLQALRQFLKWAGNPIASERSLWKLPSGAPVHRRWLTRDQLLALFRGSRGVERIIIALEGFAGLRRVEVLRLRVKDVLLKEGCLRILGKGRHGGKWRNIPLQGEVDRLLRDWVRSKRPEERVVPLSRSGADAALQRAACRSGLRDSGVKVSHHDLRRTFGRIANASGMSIVSLQGLFGHTSPALSAHYIGLDFDELKTALARMGSYLRVNRTKDTAARTRPGNNRSSYGTL